MLTIDQLTPDTIQEIVFGDEDPRFDETRRAFNLLLDQQPAAIAIPRDEREVAAVVLHARERGLRVAAQCTGHNAAPLGPLQDTILLSTSRLTGATIDAAARRVRVGAATKWEAVTPRLSELGLAALHGSSPDVGIVGYSLGGGLGWLARSHGLQCNSVTAIELVTADGDLIRCDHVHEPELFWALRGGGGSFGIVTAIEFAVHPVSELYAGALFFCFDRATEVLGAWHELLREFPDEMMSQGTILHFPDLPFVPEPVRGGSFAIIIAAFTGTEDEGRRLLAPIRDLGPTMDTFAMVAPAALGELSMDPPEPLPYMSTHDSLAGLAPQTIEELVAAAGPRSGLVGLQLRHLGGALHRVPAGAGARATLAGSFVAYGVGLVADAESAALVRSSLGAITHACAPHRVRGYPSFVEQPRGRERVLRRRHLGASVRGQGAV